MAPEPYTLKALTDIWTGDADGKPGRLIATGLLGSIRWWFEVFVRGLGGSACDPTLDGNRCPDPRKSPDDPGHHCVVCELFGCTGWARKFRFEVFEVLDDNNHNQLKRSQISRGETFKLRFTELRPICPEEWALLDLTLRLIAEYGAIGGRMVYKPSDEQNRQNQQHHRDYGLIEITKPPQVPLKTQEELKSYLEQRRWRRVDHDDFAWASLTNFWSVKERYLTRENVNRSSFNRVLGRHMGKNRGQQLFKPEPANQWLAGRQQESKKVFSFKKPPRTFGFINPGTVDFNEMRHRLSQAWSGFQDSEFLEGRSILETLLNAGEGVTR